MAFCMENYKTIKMWENFKFKSERKYKTNVLEKYKMHFYTNDKAR